MQKHLQLVLRGHPQVPPALYSADNIRQQEEEQEGSEALLSKQYAEIVLMQ